MLLRISFSVALLISVLFLPLWLSLLLALAGMFYFPIFLEGLVLLLLSDLLYGVEEARFLNITFVSLVMGGVALILVEFLKKKLKFYS